MFCTHENNHHPFSFFEKSIRFRAVLGSETIFPKSYLGGRQEALPWQSQSNPTRGIHSFLNAIYETCRFSLKPNDARRLADLCGPCDEHLEQIKKNFQVQVRHRGNQFELEGAQNACTAAKGILIALYEETASQQAITPEQIHIRLQEINQQAFPNAPSANSKVSARSSDQNEDDVEPIKTRIGLIRPRGQNQKQYLSTIKKHDINFGIGPAGTGKTYLAVACAVSALENDEVRRIILVRPAVEAGEKLGFLPGDLAEKINPYLRPLYDALYEMLGFERVSKLIDRQVIEVAPLAYMRGRTLNNAFIILDESQNTTIEQMKMFLTRIGFSSKAVITGDITQIDLSKGIPSGLRHAIEVLNGVKGIGFTHFQPKDVVRHTLVQKIIEAYDRHQKPSDNEH